VTDAELRDAVASALEGLPFVARAMFGGYGLYLDGAFFGVISDGVLYYRTDDASRAHYIEQGMPALQPRHRPRGPKTVDRNFRVPDAVLSDAVMLRDWALRAASAGRRSSPHTRGARPMNQ
jgi:DNA transformation protein